MYLAISIIFRIFHGFSGFFNKGVKLLRSRSIQATSTHFYGFIENMLPIDVVNQSFRSLKQSQVFFVHFSPLSQIEISVFSVSLCSFASDGIFGQARSKLEEV